jgi:hypothetical protein
MPVLASDQAQYGLGSVPIEGQTNPVEAAGLPPIAGWVGTTGGNSSRVSVDGRRPHLSEVPVIGALRSARPLNRGVNRICI